MKPDMSYTKARDLLLKITEQVEGEMVPLEETGGRVLANDLTAMDDVPGFDRSPYDGYAVRSADTQGATRRKPVTLLVADDIPAGWLPEAVIGPGMAAKVATGAPIPEGADAVVMFEKTEFSEGQVKLFAPLAPGENVVPMGDDVRAGDLLARGGTVVDPALMGTLAGQGIVLPMVRRKPRVAVISTGSELLEPTKIMAPGKIFNANRYWLTAALEGLGCQPVYLGIAPDFPEAIAQLLAEGLEGCDAAVLTGGVSVGDHDVTPAAMEMTGVEIVCRGVNMKPGMACCYGVREGKPVFALSGNPASAMTNFYAVAVPSIRKLRGEADCLPREITVILTDGFKKKSPVTRLLRGKLDLTDGAARMTLGGRQGNGILSSAVGCDVMAVIPARSGPVAPGAALKGFLL